jgi:hypothetical protein
MYGFTRLCAYLQVLTGIVLMIAGLGVAGAALAGELGPWAALTTAVPDQPLAARVALAVVAVIAGIGLGAGCVLRGRMALLSIQQRRALGAINKKLNRLETALDRYEANVWAFREAERQPRVRAREPK